MYKMKAVIFSNKDQIGTCVLEVSDNSMGVLSGIFIPNEYYESIRQHMWTFNNSNRRDFEFYNKLRLNVQLENGYFLFPTGGISILDIEELKDEPIQLDVSGVFRHVIEDYFENTISELPLQQPWEFISIEQKIAFEDELKKEVGLENRKEFFGFLRNRQEGHYFKDVEVSALAHTGMNDAVLFAMYRPQSEFDFVVVHLTWKGKLESDPKWPRAEYYKSFDDFKHKRMFPDKLEWES